jgi:hypothetical protein
MKRLLLTLTTLLFFYATNSYSTTLTGTDGGTINVKELDSVQVDMIDVPENEQWMVDRILAQNPDLKAKDISRVEYSFGVYYGQINKSNIANGKGILGVTDPITYKENVEIGIETTFKNGKLGKKSEQTFLTVKNIGIITADSVIMKSVVEKADQKIVDEFEARNRAFNNGFDLSGNLGEILSIKLELIYAKFGLDIVWYNNAGFRPEDVKELQDIARKIAVAINNLGIMGGVDFNEKNVEQLNKGLDDLKNFATKKSAEKIKGVINKSPANVLLDGLRLGLADAELKNELKEINEAVDLMSMLTKKDLSTKEGQEEFIKKLRLNFLVTEPKEGGLFTNIRRIENFNMKKNKRKGYIEGKGPNGKFYELKFILDNNGNVQLALTPEDKKRFDNDMKKGGDGDGGGGEGGGGC